MPKPGSRRKKQGQRVERIVPEDVPRYYTNSVEVLTSMYDVQLRIGVIEEAGEEGLVIRTTARVFMSPQHAKSLADVLTRNVREYEERFGTLSTGPDTDVE